eukprot:COSAG01_NODE_56580_length_317_cov_1.151376_2_plen_29_part_01
MPQLEKLIPLPSQPVAAVRTKDVILSACY